MKKYCLISILLCSMLCLFIPKNILIILSNSHSLKTNSVNFSNVTIISDGYNGIYWNNESSFSPNIATDLNGGIHVVWGDNTNGIWDNDAEIMYSSYTEDLGWANITVISDGYNGDYWNTGGSSSPDITIDTTGKIHVVWADGTYGPWGNDGEIMYAFYTEELGWSNATVISDGYLGYYWNNDSSYNPSIINDINNNIHVVWQDQTIGAWGTDIEIMYVSYTEGSGWSNATIVSDGYNDTYWNDGLSASPKIVVGQLNKVHIVWYDQTNGTWGIDNEVMYASYTEELGWSNATVISDDETQWNNGNSNNPSVAIDDSNQIHIVWQDDTDGVWGNDREIMYINYIEGIGWSNATVISDGYNGTYWNDGGSFKSKITSDMSGDIHVIWYDYTDGLWGNDDEIMYASYSEGLGWSNATVISDGYNETYWNDGSSINSKIAIDFSGKVHIVWQDTTDGLWGSDSEIMYVSISIQQENNMSINLFFYINISFSIFLLGIIGLFLFYRDKLEIRKSISDKKKKLADISSIVLTSTVVSLQIYQIIDNAQKYPQGIIEEPLIQIFPIILLITSLLILILLIISVISSLQEYKSYLIFKRNKIVSNRRLDFEKIFENDNRKKIIENILFNPGIHFKELLRECFLQRGQLQWHLKVLLEYGIIKSKKIGQYITYFPCYEDLDSRKYNIKLMKSETSMKILSLIAKFPGINPSTIAEKIGIKKNTVNYHINKMKKSELIVSQKEGRNLKIYLIEEISIEL